VRLAQQPRRTVLAQEACDACMLLITRLCENASAEEMVETMSWMDSLGCILQAQLAWKSSTTKKRSAKRQAQLALIENWIRLNEDCRNRNLYLEWRQQVVGYRLEEGYLHWGGLCHLFSGKRISEQQPANDDLEKVWSLLEKPAGNPVDRSMLLRGALFHLATTKEPAFGYEVVHRTLRTVPHCKRQENCALAVSIL
jgi:hypothetical protein